MLSAKNAIYMPYRCVSGILLLCVSLCLWYGAGLQRTIAASSGLELQIQAGYDGKVKEGRWFPVTFTLKNPNENISGDLVVRTADPSGGKDITYVKHVDLPKASTKVVHMTLPGMIMNKDNNSVTFFQGSLNQGEKIALIDGNDYIETSAAHALQVGVLSKDPDTLNFLTLLGTKGLDIGVTRLNLEQLPSEPLMLDGLDAIAFNGFASDQLTEEQIKAISSWVQRGGTLILAGGAGYPETAKAFENISPVKYEGTTSLNLLSSLEKASGKELKLPAPFTVSSAHVTAGETVYAEGHVPLMVRRAEGEGYVWYVAYDLSQQPLASWNGNPSLWAKVLENRMQAAVPVSGKEDYPAMAPFWDMQNILDYFPSMKSPSFILLFIIFLIYVIVVAPLLYALLKKLDKREWAWVVIPAISLLSSIGIFAAGASDKSSVLTHTLNTIEMNGNGQGHRSSATAVFVPGGGSYEIELPKSAQIVTLGEGAPRPENGAMSGASDQFLFFETDKTRLEWRGVPYWSVRKAWVDRGIDSSAGQFTIQASADAAGLRGEIANQTAADLYNVSIIMNRRAEKIGDLKKGEKKSFQLAASGGMQQGYTDYGSMLFAVPQQAGADPYFRERQMINTYMNRIQGTGFGSGRPLVVGWSKDHDSWFKLNGRNFSSDELNLWVQHFDLQLIQGNKIILPSGYLKPAITGSTMQSFFQEPGGNLQIGGGDLTIEYSMPDIEGASYSSLTLESSGGYPPFVTIQLWNNAKREWEALDLSSQVKFKQDLQQYFVEDRTIRLKVSATQTTMFQYPSVSLEGTVK